jgi:hypothetical protein
MYQKIPLESPSGDIRTFSAYVQSLSRFLEIFPRTQGCFTTCHSALSTRLGASIWNTSP